MDQTQMDFWTDTHAHVYVDEFKSDRDEMMSRAEQAGVGKVFMPNIDHTSIDVMLETEAKYTGRCFAMMGLHPGSVKKDFEKELYKVEAWLAKRKFSAVGEIGTDLYWDKTFWEQQKEAFIVQVKWAKKYKLPVVIHCRESMNETIELLKPFAGDGLGGIFHCFSGSAEQARSVTDLGFHLGIGGVATFKKGGLDSVLPAVSPLSIVLETDSPYLAPVPHRGKRNEPAYILLVANKVAELMRLSLDDLKKVSTTNALTIFGH